MGMILGLIWIVGFFWAVTVGICASRKAEKITKTYKLFCQTPQSLNSVGCLTDINGCFWAFIGAIAGLIIRYNIVFNECTSQVIDGNKSPHVCGYNAIFDGSFFVFPGALIGALIGLIINIRLLQSLKLRSLKKK